MGHSHELPHEHDDQDRFRFQLQVYHGRIENDDDVVLRDVLVLA